jgi:azurin
MLKNVFFPFLFAGFVSSVALADDCKLELDGNDQMQFDKKELKLPEACRSKEITLTLKHSGKLPKNVMGHNVVVYAEGPLGKDNQEPHFNAVVAGGIKAGLAANHVDQSQVGEGNGKFIVGFSPVIGGGDKPVTVTFKPKTFKADKTYGFVCTFPGHSAMMKGKLVFEKTEAKKAG